MQAIQSGAPMAGAPAAPQPVPFDSGTQNPDEPVTAGAALGPGVGPQAAGIQSDDQATAETMRPLLRSLGVIANLPGSNAQTRSYYRRLAAKLTQ
jgi:hypothetical protein